MATTKTQNATRLARIIRHQDDISNFKRWATLHVCEDYDLADFRRRLSRYASGLNFVLFLEWSKSGKRIHFHFLFRDKIGKSDFRAILVKSLRGKRIDYQHKMIDPERKKGLWKYLAKSTPNLQRKNRPLKGMRTTASYGKPFEKSRDELAKLTRKEHRNWVYSVLKGDPFLAWLVASKQISHEQLWQPQFMYWYSQGCIPIVDTSYPRIE